jgi:CrcB protein
MLKFVAIIGVGSFIGGICRYLVGYVFEKYFEISFPLGTLTINIVGSLIIGIIYGLVSKGMISPEWRFFLATGFCGGFTTFSSFAYENVAMMEARLYFQTALYIGASVVIGLAAAYFGAMIGKAI